MNEQLNIFSVFRRDFRINNKIRLIELFAGVGSQAMALDRVIFGVTKRLIQVDVLLALN